MMISSTVEYALRLMAVLTARQNGWVTGAELAGASRVPAEYALKILHILGRSNLIESQRGRKGGYRLRCDPNRTTVLEVVRAVEPMHRITTCPLGDPAHEGGLCPMHECIDSTIGYLETLFGRTTLRELVAAKNPPAAASVGTDFCGGLCAGGVCDRREQTEYGDALQVGANFRPGEPH